MRIFVRASGKKQRGAAAVEFALIAMFFFAVLFGIIEFGRALFVWNSVQEVTRYVAREAVVCWRDRWMGNDTNYLQYRGFMGMNALPAAPELATTNISIEALRRAPNASGQLVVLGNSPATVDENISNCASSDTPTPRDCIGYVRVTVNASFTPLIGTLLWFPLPDIPLPPSTVVMPAESLGFMRTRCAA